MKQVGGWRCALSFALFCIHSPAFVTWFLTHAHELVATHIFAHANTCQVAQCKNKHNTHNTARSDPLPLWVFLPKNTNGFGYLAAWHFIMCSFKYKSVWKWLSIYAWHMFMSFCCRAIAQPAPGLCISWTYAQQCKTSYRAISAEQRRQNTLLATMNGHYQKS